MHALFVFTGFARSVVVEVSNPSPVPLGSVARFQCKAFANGLWWEFNGTNATEERTEVVPGQTEKSSTLSVLAIPENNGTQAVCNAFNHGRFTNSCVLFIYGSAELACVNMRWLYSPSIMQDPLNK